MCAFAVVAENKFYTGVPQNLCSLSIGNAKQIMRYTTQLEYTRIRERLWRGKSTIISDICVCKIVNCICLRFVLWQRLHNKRVYNEWFGCDGYRIRLLDQTANASAAEANGIGSAFAQETNKNKTSISSVMHRTEKLADVPSNHFVHAFQLKMNVFFHLIFHVHRAPRLGPEDKSFVCL